VDKYWSSKTSGDAEAPNPPNWSQTLSSICEVSVRPSGKNFTSEANPCRKSFACEGAGAMDSCVPRTKSNAVPTTPLSVVALNWSARHCLDTGISVIAAATISESRVSSPLCGAMPANAHAGRLSYISPRVPSIGSMMHFHCVAPAATPSGKHSSPSTPSITTCTGISAGQFFRNQSFTAPSPNLSTA